jgi:hypothetical protein
MALGLLAKRDHTISLGCVLSKEMAFTLPDKAYAIHRTFYPENEV